MQYILMKVSPPQLLPDPPIILPTQLHAFFLSHSLENKQDGQQKMNSMVSF